jgi:diamine N-acetyltransferase
MDNFEKPNQINRRAERMLSSVDLIPTTEEDLDLIISWEAKEPNVIAWSKDKHKEIIANPEYIHFLIKKKGEEELIPVGYAVLKKDSPDESSVEFIRLVISDEYKQRGYGVYAFENIWDLVFNKLNYPRIWHDVFVENEKAIKLYDKLGYRRFNEGVDPSTNRELIFYEMTKDEYTSQRSSS